MAESIRTIRPTLDFLVQPRLFRPSVREWVVHGSLFILTMFTTTIAGVMLAAPELPDPQAPPLSGPLDYLLYVPIVYVRSAMELFSYAVSHPGLLMAGATFAAALLAILLSHEMGHYLACRYYGVSATLPFFIPAPPLFLAGTFGAFIKIRSPIPTRRALFDIGLAGPLAGFIALLPIAAMGILNLGAPLAPSGHEIVLNDPLLLRLLSRLLSV